jgi:cytochrome c oxidase cbb3-type subunit 3
MGIGPGPRVPWTTSAPRAGRLAAAALGLLLIGGAGVLARTWSLDDRLVRARPEELPAAPSLMRYAVAKAEPTYQRECAGCHKADMHGDRTSGAPDLTDQDWLYGRGSIIDIQQTLTYGVRSGLTKSRDLAVMPAFAHPDPAGREKVDPLTPGQIEDVIDYLFSIEGRPHDPAAAERGAKVYYDTGVCYDCHSRDAQGDQTIGAPNLVDKVWLYGDGSRAALARSISQGRAGACPGFQKRLPPVMLRALAALIYARSHPAKPA